MSKAGLIYVIENKINHKKYVGQTVKSLDERFCEHIIDSKNGSNYEIHKAIREFGEDNFSINTLLDNVSLDKLDYYEKFWIKKLNTHYKEGYGYNMTWGGKGTQGYIFTPEDRIKVSNANYKRIYTEERNKKISNALKGKKFSLEHRMKLSEIGKRRVASYNSFFGKHHSEESKRLISQANSHPVLMLDKNSGNIIKSFKSLTEATQWLIDNNLTKNKSARTRITSVCNNEKYANSAYGYKWKYSKKV